MMLRYRFLTIFCSCLAFKNEQMITNVLPNRALLRINSFIRHF